MNKSDKADDILQQRRPKQIEEYSPTEILIVWSTGEKFSLPFLNLRFECPCALCIDEHTGARKIKLSSIAPEIKPTKVELVGRYAIQIFWNDAHSTGMYHYDRLYDLCKLNGTKL